MLQGRTAQIYYRDDWFNSKQNLMIHNGSLQMFQPHTVAFITIQQSKTIVNHREQITSTVSDNQP